jgi:NADPH:quinone reductase-like Zn-dependent oxidoreductase
LRAVRDKGRIVIVGFGGGWDSRLDLRRVSARRVSIVGTVLRSRPKGEKTRAVRAFARKVCPHFEAGAVQPLVNEVFPAGRIREALVALERPGKLGKLLLSFED